MSSDDIAVKATGKKVCVISLGCDKNRVDTENILYRLGEGGYFATSDMRDADVIIINTCAFISAAEKEAVDTVFEAAWYKQHSKCRVLAVAGCLPMRYKEKLLKLLPEVDCFIGMNDYADICGIIERRDRLSMGGKGEETAKRVLSTPPHYAYLKIADGCDNHCTYCAIPSIRGKYRSRTPDSLLEEAAYLDDMGVRELIIVAQDVTRYGIDLRGEYMLVPLLKRLLSERSFETIRLLYCYPESVSDELIELMASEPRIAKYIDIPLQHISDPVLRRMGRKTDSAQIKKLFEKLKSYGITIRTTFIVGFPGETEEQFDELVDFVEQYKPDHAGVFAYSREEGTPAARMNDQIPARIKRRRADTLGGIIRRIAEERNSAFVGKILKVVYEDIDYDKGMFVGRTEADAPEIDGLVYFTGDFCDVGNMYDVIITGYDGYDLLGEKV